MCVPQPHLTGACDAIVHSCSQFCIQRGYTGSLNLAMGVFIARKSANTTNQGFCFLESWFGKQFSALHSKVNDARQVSQ